MHRDSRPPMVAAAVTVATSTSRPVTSGVQAFRVNCISNVTNVDLHSDLSLEHGGCSCGTPLVIESEGQWRKHTMLKISYLE